jgi:hypothetical protein
MADQGITLGDASRSDGLDEAVFEELRANFRGELLRLRDDGYDVARAVFNGMIDRRPALIARCAAGALGPGLRSGRGRRSRGPLADQGHLG